MGEIIRLGDEHFEVKGLLPWYVNGSLGPAECAEVEAHLADCAECRAELNLERSLGAQIANLPFDVEQGWASLRPRLEQQAARPRASTAFGFLKRPIGLGWALAVQAAACLVLVVAASVFFVRTDQGPYHTLGSPEPARTGSLLVVFKPTTSEQELREILRRSGARLVDGPTSADAYVLETLAGGLPAALSQLRADRRVVLAEPIDRDARP